MEKGQKSSRSNIQM